MSGIWLWRPKNILNNALNELWENVGHFSSADPIPPVRELEEVMECFAPREDDPAAHYSQDVANAAVASVAEDLGMPGANLGIRPGERGQTLSKLIEAALATGILERWPGWTKERAYIELHELVDALPTIEDAGFEEAVESWFSMNCRGNTELANEIIREFQRDLRGSSDEGSVEAREKLLTLHSMVRQADSMGHPIWRDIWNDIEEGE